VACWRQPLRRRSTVSGAFRQNELIYENIGKSKAGALDPVRAAKLVTVVGGRGRVRPDQPDAIPARGIPRSFPRPTHRQAIHIDAAGDVDAFILTDMGPDCCVGRPGVNRRP